MDIEKQMWESLKSFENPMYFNIFESSTRRFHHPEGTLVREIEIHSEMFTLVRTAFNNPYIAMPLFVPNLFEKSGFELEDCYDIQISAPSQPKTSFLLFSGRQKSLFESLLAAGRPILEQGSVMSAYICFDHMWERDLSRGVVDILLSKFIINPGCYFTENDQLTMPLLTIISEEFLDAFFQLFYDIFVNYLAAYLKFSWEFNDPGFELLWRWAQTRNHQIYEKSELPHFIHMERPENHLFHFLFEGDKDPKRPENNCFSKYVNILYRD